jgi:hypothetical protein
LILKEKCFVGGNSWLKTKGIRQNARACESESFDALQFVRAEDKWFMASLVETHGLALFVMLSTLCHEPGKVTSQDVKEKGISNTCQDQQSVIA